MSERFYVEPTENRLIELRDVEARHIARVMRLGPGDQIALFDGRGRECRATIESVSKNTVCVVPEAWQTVSREPHLAIVVATALPKGDRLKFMVEKLTELGVTELIPLIAERSSVRPKENTISKMRRYVIEASKQCGRNHLMTVRNACPMADAIQLPKQGSRKYICDPRSENDFAFPPQKPASIWFLIGPEGGFTAAEVDIANASEWVSVRLGTRILRIETAALATCVSALNISGGYDLPPE